ncbi:MAG: NAD-binding protein [Fimbriimonadaceae bacterium]
MILVGGGNVGTQLAKKLISSGHEVLVIEKEPTQAQRLQRMIGEANVLIGDGCEVLTQKSAGFGRAEVVVAITGEDEDNLIICQMAKFLWNVKRALARVNNPEHERLFQELGIDETVSATAIIFSLLEQQISPDVVMPVGALQRGNIEVVEAVLSSRSPIVGKAVRDVPLPPGTNLVWILRNDQGLMVTGDTVLHADDTLMALVPRGHEEDLHQLLMPAKT